jgi:LmbE family N-acetylglucosaminyl deacetylase
MTEHVCITCGQPIREGQPESVIIQSKQTRYCHADHTGCQEATRPVSRPRYKNYPRIRK